MLFGYSINQDSVCLHIITFSKKGTKMIIRTEWVNPSLFLVFIFKIFILRNSSIGYISRASMIGETGVNFNTRQLKQNTFFVIYKYL